MKTKLAGMGGAPAQTYVDDVFSTTLYTGTGAVQTITNGIDLAGKGGLVWTKARATISSSVGPNYHGLVDSARGVAYNKMLFTNTTDPQDYIIPYITAFNSNGFTTDGSGQTYVDGVPWVSWTFRKAAKFFDVVTYTGTGSARTIAHSLGVAPGMIIVKNITGAAAWAIYSNGLGATKCIFLNATNAAATNSVYWNNTNPTDLVFTVGSDATTNQNGDNYVAYLFAHDTSSTGIIQCGSFTTNGSAGATVNLGWEPQYILMKTTDLADNWNVFDTMRGFAQTSSMTLKPNLANAEGEFGSGTVVPTATGFNINLSVGGTYYNNKTFIYMAIRRPNKPPTSGTQVYNAIARTGTDAPATVSGFNFPVDLTWHGQRAGVYGSSNVTSWDRLRGAKAELYTGRTDAEGARNGVTSFAYMDAVEVSNPTTAGEVNYPAGNTGIFWGFKRAPGFFDVVCYTGTGVTRTVAHNLGVAPELMIVKRRDQLGYWAVYSAPRGNTQFQYLNTTDGLLGPDANMWNNTSPTYSVFTVGTAGANNTSGSTYVAYLFATLAGISKVGSYTGNGSSQNIECGFAAGARFFLVKATSTTGSWWVWDSARGITAGNDPALQLNSTAAEITTADAVDPYSPGITVNQEATCSINASGVSYIFLAVA